MTRLSYFQLQPLSLKYLPGLLVCLSENNACKSSQRATKTASDAKHLMTEYKQIRQDTHKHIQLNDT
ncbi:hypothetical protein BaRGS_00028581 [Batillaria attramentaria]|uniref:Uncharacterized protein n=1 Tax=Batillaria attramentaria TaxID=370345 RepID=A0ABD0JZV6_9CAEN